LGNGLLETTGYNARLQPLSIGATLGGASYLGLQYRYCPDFSDVDAQHTCSANNGNMWRQIVGFDAIGPASGFAETQTYTYDRLNRLTGASAAGWSQTYLYDAFGNRALLAPGSSDPSAGMDKVFVMPASSSTAMPFDSNNRW